MALEDPFVTKSSAKPEMNKYDDPIDPLYLHHCDQPGAILVTQQLNEENYSTWSRAMSMALSAKNKEGFIDETIKKSEGAFVVELQQWTRRNNLVKLWLLNSISQDIRVSVIYSDIAHEIWNDLKEPFSHVNNVHLFHIEQEIHGCIQGNMNIGVGAYYTKLKGFWDERDALCSIPNCTFETVKVVLWFQQSQKTMKFLMGLNDAYAAVRGQILLMDPLPAVNKDYSLIIQDEKQRAVSNHAFSKASITDVVAFVVQDNSRNSCRNFTPKNPYLNCDRCNTIGHTSETCRAHLKCKYYGWKGYIVDQCHKLKNANSYNDKADYQDRKGFISKVNHVDTNPTSLTLPPPSYGLTVEQYHHLFALLDGESCQFCVEHE